MGPDNPMRCYRLPNESGRELNQKTMKSDKQQTPGALGRRCGLCALLLCVLGGYPAIASAATVRDNFDARTWSNNDGSTAWSGDWIEVDGNSAPPVQPMATSG